MIEFKPDIKDNIVIYNAFENGKETGRITLVFEKTRSEIKFIEADNDETAEGLIRSALTAAANRNVFSCVYEPQEFKTIALNLGFADNNGKLYGEIPFLLSGCCGCQHNKLS